MKISRFKYTSLATMLVAVATSCASGVQAATYQFGCIADASSASSDCSRAEAQIFMDVISSGTNQVAFTFRNTGPAASSIEGVYFDNGALLGISYLTDADEGTGGVAGVDFTAGSAAPPELPRATNLTPDFETTAGFLADSDAPAMHNGVNPYEWLTVVFDLQSDGTYDMVLAELLTGEVRVGLHVIGFESGGSESLVNNITPVPVPAASLLFLSGLIGLGRFRKTRRCRAVRSCYWSAAHGSFSFAKQSATSTPHSRSRSAAK